MQSGCVRCCGVRMLEDKSESTFPGGTVVLKRSTYYCDTGSRKRERCKFKVCLLQKLSWHIVQVAAIYFNKELSAFYMCMYNNSTILDSL